MAQLVAPPILEHYYYCNNVSSRCLAAIAKAVLVVMILFAFDAGLLIFVVRLFSVSFRAELYWLLYGL